MERNVLRVESLEPRHLLSASGILFDPNTEQVTIVGSSGVDEVFVSLTTPDTLRVRLRSAGETSVQDFERGDIRSISFYGNAGNDSFTNTTELRSIAYGGLGDDILTGGSGSDTFDGGDGDDELEGLSGNDLLSGGLGVDRLRGGTGDDRLSGDSGNDNLNGEDGNDTVDGSGGDDYVRGSTGNDTLLGGDGHDELFGDEGNDNLSGDEGNDLLEGLDGDDYLRGGAGDDRLRGRNGHDELHGDEGDDNLIDGEGNDSLYGYDGADYLRGGLGDDSLRGGAGDDQLFGDEGSDSLYGDEGNDVLEGLDGNDYIRGGVGNDKLAGDAGHDQLFGDGGADDLFGDDGNDSLYGLSGNDYLRGGLGNDKLRGGVGDDQLYGDEGDDNLRGDDGDDLLEGQDGSDFLRGGSGTDRLRGGADGDQLIGDQGNDNLLGDEGDDLIYGLDGEDYIRGGLGNDRLWGGVDDDQLFGDDGDDELVGNDGNDLLDGLNGDDLLVGGAGADDLQGRSGRDQLFGDQGNDRLVGHDGDDLLHGSDGNDTLNGHAGHDVLIGSLGDDLILGDSGDDILVGGAGSDNLQGQAGIDLLIGAAAIYENDVDAMRSLQLAWSLGGAYSQRISLLENGISGVRLESGETVIDDQIADTIFGDEDLDWFFLTGSMPIYTPVAGHSEHEHEHGAGGHQHPDEIVNTVPELEGFELIAALDKLADHQSSEAIHSKVPHTDDLRRQTEHLALFELVRYDQVTHFAIADGDWSSPSTWLGGEVPTDGARVLISHGTHVTVDRVITARLATVRVDGTLSFATQSRSELRVDTLIVSSSGALEMGTEAAPIAPNVTARLLITNSGAIDRSWDPYGISRGVISHGRVTMHGTTVLERSTVPQSIAAGTNRLTLTDVPLGWKVGDEVVIAGTIAGVQQNEVRRILAISGRTITIAPLDYDHLTLDSTVPVQIAHLTRNAVIESESRSTSRQGHVMFMHTRDVNVQYAGFYHLGRTDKSIPINDPSLDSNWTLQSGTGTNPRGRYAVHFHRNGLNYDGNPAVIHGSVVTDSPGWGFVNHSSYVDMSNNVAFDVYGAAFATEVGDEIGSFHNNIAIQMKGSGQHVNARDDVQDFGHQGDGFWLQGGGVSVTDNVAAGSAGSAFIFYTRGLIEGGERQLFRSENLVDPSISGGAPTILVDFVPVREFTGNVGLASGTGLSVRYNLRNVSHTQKSLFQDSTFWNNVTGVDLTYSQNSILKDLAIISSDNTWAGTGVASNGVTQSIVYDNLTVAGYSWGIEMARGGSSVVNGGTYANKRNIVVQTATSNNRAVLITGPITFVPLSESVYPSFLQFDVVMRSDLEDNMASAFYSDTVTQNYGSFQNRRVYFRMQAPSSIPFLSPMANLPIAYVGLTSQQLHVLFGLTVGGELAPITAASVPRIDGLVGL